jgi:hypothetical protein
LFFFHLRGKVVLLLDHRSQEKQEPVFPVLLPLADGLLGTPQRQVIVVLVCLDNTLHRAVRNVPVPDTQQQQSREDTRESAAVFEGMDRQEHHDENPNQYQWMLRFFANRVVEPIDEFLHPSGRFERCGRFKHNTQTLAIATKGLDVVRHFFVMPAMLLVLAAVFEKNTLKLLDVVFVDRYGVKTLENHVHRIGIAGDFLLVAACE